MKEPKTPTLEKMGQVHDKSQAIGEFLEWLTGERGIFLAESHHHNEYCYVHGKQQLADGERKRWDYPGQAKYIGEKEVVCGYQEGEYVSSRYNTEGLLADYFDIDLSKAEEEKQSLLDYIRSKS